MTEAWIAATPTRGTLGHSAGVHTSRLDREAIVALDSAICGGEFAGLQSGKKADARGVCGGAKLAAPRGLTRVIIGGASGAANSAAPEAARYSTFGGVGNA